jgi:omega-6 fatty acid desaturase (delta-12 desaturase)
LHHVHHLSARIPNYNLQRAHDENPVFQTVPRLNAWDGVRALQLKLYDEDRGRMVTFRDAHTARRSREHRPSRVSVITRTDAVILGRRSSKRPGRVDAHAGRAAKPDDERATRDAS